MVKSLQWIQHPMNCCCGRCNTACMSLEEIEIADTYDPALAFVADYRVALLQSEIQYLSSKLAALQEENVRLRQGLEWQTGTMPREGWYWIKDDPSEPDIINPFCTHVEDLYLYMHLQWAGPILMPVEKEGK